MAPSRTTTGVVFIAFAIAMLILGFVGLLEFLPQPEMEGSTGAPRYETRVLDVLYWDLQLFVLDSAPLAEGGTLPISLQVARFGAPATTGYALFITASAILGRQIAVARARRARGHTIICGTEPAMIFLARELRAEDRAVVMIEHSDSTAAPVLPAGVLRVVGDPRMPDVLERAGAYHASEVMALTPDGTYNAEIALAVRSLAIRSLPGAVCYAEVDDRDLCAEMAARAVAMDVSSSMRIDFFSRHDRAARQLLDRYPLPTAGSVTPAVLIVGSGPLAQALLVEVTRRWTQTHTPGQSTLPVRLLGTDPATAGMSIAVAPAAGAIAVTTGTADLATIKAAADLDVGHGAGACPPTHVFVALEVESSAIRFGLKVTRLLAAHDPLVVVAAASSTVFGRVLGDGATATAVVRSRLALHNVVETVYSPNAVRRGNVEDIARAAHDAYLAGCRARGETPVTNPSMVPWEELPERLRDDNRSQAADIGHKLSAIGAAVVPATGHDEAFAFSDDEIELLAQMEHDRWVRRRRAQGWSQATDRDDELRHHPDIAEWGDLSELTKDKDRDAVRAMPDQLGAAGFAVVRGSAANATRRRPT